MNNLELIKTSDLQLTSFWYILKLFLSKSKTAWLKIEKKRQYMRELTSNSAEVLPMKVFKAVVEILKLFSILNKYTQGRKALKFCRKTAI